MFTKIIGTGGYLPNQVRSNFDLEKIIHKSESWIFSRTGIRTRHIANINETVSIMGGYAAKKAIKMANIKSEEIGMIIVSTVSSSHAFPSSACQIQHMLGIKDSISFDISAACTGFIYAISIADNFIKNKKVNYALVIGSDILSHTLDPNDKNTIILFGDGAGAVILTKSNIPGIISTNLHANGRNSDLLTLPYYNKISSFSPPYLKMLGKKIFKFAISNSVNVIRKILNENNISLKEIDWFIPHQANFRIISAITKKIGFDLLKQVIITLDRHGNTSSASLPLALNEAVRDKRVKSGNLILLEAFGGGLTWGSILLNF